MLVMFPWLRRGPVAPTEQQLHVKQALSDYPPYAPPEWNGDLCSLADASNKYREYFLGGKDKRLEALRGFLEKFDVLVNPDDTGLMAVSTWLPQYADLLVDDLDDDTVQDAYRGFTLPWTGPLSGLNPIFDLGIYFAECLWHRRTKLGWIVLRAPDRGFGSHAISGLPGGRFFDPIRFMYVECRNIRNTKRSKQKRTQAYEDSMFLRSDTFCRRVLSYAPPGRRSRKR
ncbi:hypothetical protein EAS56_06150 [Bradyrhizobium guangzhouense]|uniref:Uncharacterized protein n=1 Tax=Bradyrhizobium guangzhouense TaxID=1325095 RepID=A0ABY0EBE2_9BRAD|nr:hypothetical protein EAS56_06150 [Bradyrhizobium guangzhouense]